MYMKKTVTLLGATWKAAMSLKMRNLVWISLVSAFQTLNIPALPSELTPQGLYALLEAMDNKLDDLKAEKAEAKEDRKAMKNKLDRFDRKLDALLIGDENAARAVNLQHGGQPLLQIAQRYPSLGKTRHQI